MQRKNGQAATFLLPCFVRLEKSSFKELWSRKKSDMILPQRRRWKNIFWLFKKNAYIIHTCMNAYTDTQIRQFPPAKPV